MVGRVGRRRAVAATNAAGLEAGLRLGQAVAHATATTPGLVLHDLDAAGDAAALHRLALWAQKLYSPVVAVDGADGLIVDASGCAHRFGGEEKMLIDIRARLSTAGYAVAVALADSWGGAHALARWSRRPIFAVPSGATSREIASLPLAALRLPADLVQTLSSVGFDTIGELEQTPKGPLARRYGLEPIRRLDQAHGRVAEPIQPVFAPETPRASRIFAEPIGAPETLARYLTELTQRLCADLEAQSLGALRLDAYFIRVDNRIETARLGLSKPSRDAPRLAKLLCGKLDTIDPGFGVEKMMLAAPGAEPLTYRQDEALDDGVVAPDLASLVDTLSTRLGPENVYRLTSVDSDIPERSVRKAAALEAFAAHSWPIDWRRPSRLLRHPEPIETLALLPDAPPNAFTWRGKRRRVRCADGPERVFGEWWKRDEELSTSRDYFQVEDEGGERFWIFRAGDGEHADSGSQRWYMHGLFG